MAKGKIDFRAAATKMAGHAAGAAAYTQFNKLAFMTKQTNPKVKGLISALAGYIGVPLIAEKLKLSGKGAKADFISNIGEGMGMVGVMQMANSFVPPTAGKPALFPQISGYEENPVSGLGLITEEDNMDGVSGYEENPISGLADNPVS